jgi:voltage-gated potassium channel
MPNVSINAIAPAGRGGHPWPAGTRKDAESSCFSTWHVEDLSCSICVTTALEHGGFYAMSAPIAGPGAAERKDGYAIRAVLRSFASVVALVAIYFALPIQGFTDPTVVGRLVLSVLCLVVILGWQITAVSRSSRPTLRAIEAVAVTVPLFILMVSSTYVLTSQLSEQSFTEDLSKIDALYFAMAVFSTVGFGDIAPRSDLARVAVTIQIIIDLLLLGVGIRLLVGAVNEGKRRVQPSG